MPHKSPKHATALVPFRKIGDALAAVCASRNEHKGLKDIEISWAEGNEPAVLEVLKRQGRVNSEGGLEQLTTHISPSQTEFVSRYSFVPGKTMASSAPSFVGALSLYQDVIDILGTSRSTHLNHDIQLVPVVFQAWIMSL